MTFARRRTGDPFDDLIIDELNEDAEGHLMPSQWEARAGALDEWPGDLDSLLAAAARSTYTPDESSAVVSFRLLDDEDEDPDPETLMQYLQRWAAREWISGGSDVARPLIAARRLVHPRRPVVADMAKVLMLMAFLRRDADEILHRGGEWISSTSYASLASPLRPYLDALRRNGERNLAT